MWNPAGYDEHPPVTSNPGYVTDGQNLVWQLVQAVIDGGWADTTFILTWDGWGGYADSVPTPRSKPSTMRCTSTASPPSAAPASP